MNKVRLFLKVFYMSNLLVLDAKTIKQSCEQEKQDISPRSALQWLRASPRKKEVKTQQLLISKTSHIDSSIADPAG